MKYCPTCQRRFPDLISMCPTDQSLLAETPPSDEPKPAATAAAPAPAKEPIDTRTLEEKLFAPLPKRAAEPAPPDAPPVKSAVPPAPKPAAGSTTKMMETVFEEPQQKSTKMAAGARAQE